MTPDQILQAAACGDLEIPRALMDLASLILAGKDPREATKEAIAEAALLEAAFGIGGPFEHAAHPERGWVEDVLILEDRVVGVVHYMNESEEIDVFFDSDNEDGDMPRCRYCGAEVKEWKGYMECPFCGEVQ